MMAASAIETALATFKAVLLGATSAGNVVARGRADPFDRAELPAINIRRSRSEHSDFGQRGAFHFDHITSMVEVDLEVRGDDWETLADALHLEVEAILFSSAVLASQVQGLRCTGTEATGEGGDETSGRLTVRYQFQLVTRRGDLTRQA